MKMKPPMLWLQPSSLQGAPETEVAGGVGGSGGSVAGYLVSQGLVLFFYSSRRSLDPCDLASDFLVRTHVPALCPAATVRAAWIRLSSPPPARLPSPGLRLRCARLS